MAAHHCAQRGPPHVIAAPLIPEQIAPTARARAAALGGAAIRNRAGAADEGHSPALGRAGCQQQLGVIDKRHRRAGEAPIEPGEQHRLVFGPAYARQAKTSRLGQGPGQVGRGKGRGDRLFQRGLRGLRADPLVVRRPRRAAAQHAAVHIGQQGQCLAAAAVNAEKQVHGYR
jgi:hypothetical protein